MSLVGIWLVSALVLSASSAPLVYKASLNGASTVPPVNTKATGLISVTLVNTSYASCYFFVTNINGMTIAQLHAGAVGVNGSPVAWAFNATYGSISGSIKASFTLNPSINNISALLAAGLVYFNVYTIAHPSGEIRGQLTGPGNITYPAPPLVSKPPPPKTAPSALLKFGGLTKEQAIVKAGEGAIGSSLFPCGTTTSSDGYAPTCTKSSADVPRASAVISGQFNAWSEQNNKTYEGAERGRAVRAFVTNVQTVYATNTDPSIPFVLDMNPLRGDLTYLEFRDQVLMRTRSPGSFGENKTNTSSVGARRRLATYPPALDWRTSGMLPDVKDQGNCGSCWAFSATAAMESTYRIYVGGANYPINLSEQEMVDCCNAANGFKISEGCDGGSSREAISFAFKKTQTTTSLYPYTSGNSGTAGTCSARSPVSGQVVQPSSDVIDILPQASGVTPEQALMSALTVAPVTVYFNVLDKFSLYSNGVYSPSTECSPSSSDINHAMLLVGYDTTASPLLDHSKQLERFLGRGWLLSR